MISTKNPFPGMNPFLERNWGPVHTKLIGYIDDALAEKLPPGLLSRPEERLLIDETEPGAGYRADLGVSETWKQGDSPAWEPAGSAKGGGLLVEPEILRVDDELERWIEIRTPDGRVVTVIELLRPTNKKADYARYKWKQRDLLRSEASLVEIDLLREGRITQPLPAWRLDRWPKASCYSVCCSRAWRPGTRELYVWGLRDRIPAFRIPLRPTDQDLVLDLQPLVDRCYEVGRYHAGRFDAEPAPPFEADEADWVNDRLREAGLRE